jgi:hypothetical protein
MVRTGSAPIDAERAFATMVRARRRAALARRLRRSAPDGRLAVYDGSALRAGVAHPGRRLREIPIGCIRGTLEPTKARLFDREFRAAPLARHRWQRLWLAEERGAALPPISVVPVADGYAVADGHHRVSIALARGAVMIDAEVQGAASAP